ncbi:MAG: hypothetical protein QY326_08505 [Bdellovibrionota bacterium]|nr:MAG: hypothetical protein QY326_08505 [Bdellovibrionota bacterium]
MAERVDVSNPEGWEVARNYVGLLGPIPSSFSSTIRTLVSDGEKLNESYSPKSKSLALRLARSPSLIGSLERVAREFRPSETPSDFTVQALPAIFKPSELAMLIAFIYLYRKAKKISDQDEWQYINAPLVRRAELALAVGVAIPSVGISPSLMVAGAELIGMATIHAHDKPGFKDYRRFLKSKGEVTDGAYELGRWGCTSSQIGGIVFQTAGFGIATAEAFVHSMHEADITARDEATHKARQRFLVAKDWIQSLDQSGKVPDRVHDARYYPLKDAQEQLLRQAAKVQKSGEICGWLSLAKDEAVAALEQEEGGEAGGK